MSGSPRTKRARMGPKPFLRPTPPMGIYETLYAFQSVYGEAMGATGTHPWSQGFPLTTQLKDGPALPDSVSVDWQDRRYPKAWGHPKLRTMIAEHYNTEYGSKLAAENVMIFAGGRPALCTILGYLEEDINVRIAETEYTPYYDMLNAFHKEWNCVPSNLENKFRPTNESFLAGSDKKRVMAMLSNPCNPTGVVKRGPELADLVTRAMADGAGILCDEAYEWFQKKPESIIKHIADIDATNIFVTGAATKGLQCPGIRVGWCIASRANIEVMGNYASFGMGGVSHLSQAYCCALLEPKRVAHAKKAISDWYEFQRKRYGDAFKKLGLELFTGDGGFYHWVRLPKGISGEKFNSKLFPHGAAILKGVDCDMARPGVGSNLSYYRPGMSHVDEFFRFSFGALPEEMFDSDIEILTKVMKELGQ